MAEKEQKKRDGETLAGYSGALFSYRSRGEMVRVSSHAETIDAQTDLCSGMGVGGEEAKTQGTGQDR